MGTSTRARANRTDLLLSLGLFVITFFSRVPFRTRILYHWDSVNFANAMRQFDVIKEHPQPPGYIVYVWLCRGVDLLFHDAQTTMVWISIVAGALAVVALFYLGRAMWGRRVGLIAAVFLASSPLFWFYGEIALPHSVDTFLVTLSVWWLYEVMRGRTKYLLPVIVVLSIAGGVRQQTLVFVLPLVLWAVRKVSLRRLLLAAGLGAALCLAWFVPLTVSASGVVPYLDKMRAFGARFQRDTSILMGAGWWGVTRNVRKLGMYTLYGWCAGAIPIAVYVPVWFSRRPRPQTWERLWFLVLWMAPAVIFYALIHMGQQGLVFIYLPGLLLIGAAALEWLLRGGHVKWLAAVVAGLVLINVGVFALAPEYPLGPGTQRLLTRDTLVNSDHYYEDRFALLREQFPPANTIILTAAFEHIQYYLSDYASLPFFLPDKWEREDGSLARDLQRQALVQPTELGVEPDASGRMAVVLFDVGLASFSQSSVPLERTPLAHGGVLEHFFLAEDQLLSYGPLSLGAAEDGGSR